MDFTSMMTPKLQQLLKIDRDQRLLWQRMLHLGKQRPKLTPNQAYSLATYDWIMLWGLRPKSICRYVVEQLSFVDENNRVKSILDMDYITGTNLYRKKIWDVDLDARHINLCKRFFEVKQVDSDLMQSYASQLVLTIDGKHLGTDVIRCFDVHDWTLLVHTDELGPAVTKNKNPVRRFLDGTAVMMTARWSPFLQYSVAQESFAKKCLRNFARGCLSGFTQLGQLLHSWSNNPITLL